MSNKHNKRQQELTLKKNKLISELKTVQQEQQDLKEKERQVQRDIESITRQLNLLKSAPSVTDHAVLRYIQRSRDIDIDAIRREILNNNVENCIENLGDGKYPIESGIVAVVKDKKIVTILNS